MTEFVSTVISAYIYSVAFPMFAFLPLYFLDRAFTRLTDHSI